jgi:hypothetical protein
VLPQPFETRETPKQLFGACQSFKQDGLHRRHFLIVALAALLLLLLLLLLTGTASIS